MTQKQLTDSNSDMRMKRGLTIIQNNGKSIVENEDGSFSIPSQQTHGKSYEVTLLGERFVCTCPDFEYRKIDACKHIHAVKLWIAIKTQLQNEPKPKVFADDAIPCDRCGSIHTMRYGKSGEKQVYYCKDCHHKFRESSLLKNARFNPEFVTLCLDLYFSGLSLRKIARTVANHFNIDVDFSTIYRWIQRYVPMVSEYVNTLTPQLSGQWSADELFVRMKGSQLQGRYKGLAFLWNVMDKDTRFLLASKVSENRDANGAITAFQEAIKNANGNLPYAITTDAHRSYRGGVSTTFSSVEHIAKCGINKPHANNNRVERLNGTLRERVKVQRGWKSKKSQIAEGQRIHYNFVKPHQALKGKTPSDTAGLKVLGGQNRWLNLLKSSMRGEENFK